MDYLPSIDLLRHHLVAHDRAVQEIIALDLYIEQMINCTYLTNMGEYTTPALQRLMRISIAEGLKRMYKEYRLVKWLKVQEMAETVRRMLSGASDSPQGQEDQGHALQGHAQQGQMSIMGQRSTYVSPWQPHSMGYQITTPQPYQFEPTVPTVTEPNIAIVSPTCTPRSQLSLPQPILPSHPPMVDNHERDIQIVESPAARRDLFHINNTVISSSPNPVSILDCDLDISGPRDSSDEVLDSVNVGKDCNFDISELSYSIDEVLDSVNVVNHHRHSSHSHQRHSTCIHQETPVLLQYAPTENFNDNTPSQSLVPFCNPTRNDPIGNHQTGNHHQESPVILQCSPTERFHDNIPNQSLVPFHNSTVNHPKGNHLIGSHSTDNHHLESPVILQDEPIDSFHDNLSIQSLVPFYSQIGNHSTGNYSTENHHQETSVIFQCPLAEHFHDNIASQSLVPFNNPTGNHLTGNHSFYQQEVDNQSETNPTMLAISPIIPISTSTIPATAPMMQQTAADDNERSYLDESIEWNDSDNSSYNDSEESLAGVLFAAEHLLPEEQAVRLDVEMGDMGVGHVLFDKVSAVWYNTHCRFFRAN